MKQITLAYFSPSGGTLRAGRVMAGQFDAPVRELDLLRQREAALGEDEILILALPVYAGRIPAADGLLDGLRGADTPCLLLAAYGNRHYDDALAQMSCILSGQGFVCLGAAAVVTPHIFAPQLGAGRPNEEDTVLLADLARQVEAKLERGDRRPVPLPGQPRPEPKAAVPVPKSRREQACIRCGQCAAICPTGAMDRDTLAWSTDKCISCMACVHVCPTAAMSFDTPQALRQRLTDNFSQPRPVEIFG